LCNLISEHIAAGTYITPDGWAAYHNLSTLGYQHSVIIYEENFVSPDNSEVHTQHIESTWLSLKRFLWAWGENQGLNFRLVATYTPPVLLLVPSVPLLGSLSDIFLEE
jgi:hypothetical protein